MEFSSISLEQALETLGQRLYDSQQHYEIVAIGGASLLLLGQIDRTTKDIDLLAVVNRGNLISANPLPPGLQIAIEEVGKALGLGENWLNTGPTPLLDLGLPQGFEKRLVPHHYGSLTLHCAGRLDQICFKLYASVDQGPHSKHFADLKHLSPSREELLTAQNWCITHDVSKPFADELDKAIQSLRDIHEET